MGVSLLEVVEAGGYDLSTVDDARWLLSKRQEFGELIEQAEELVDKDDERINDELEKEYKERFPEEE